MVRKRTTDLAPYLVTTQLILPREAHEIIKRHCSKNGLKLRPFMVKVFIKLSEQLQERAA